MPTADTVFGYLKLLVAALLTVLAAVALYAAEKSTPMGKLKPWLRQAIIGIVFGLLAVLATEYGVKIGGATLNVRDAAPLSAGLIFGAPAGIIAGLIGGIERYFAVNWGAGEYTRLACSISTCLAGFLAAALRKYLFDNKKTSWIYGLCAGLVMEVMHMLMIFVTNMDDIRGAFDFVRRCAAPMIIFNGLSVMLAVLLVSLIAKEPLTAKKDRRKISQAFQKWLLVCVVVAFAATCIFTLSLQTRLSSSDTERLLDLNINDVRADVSDASDENLIKITRAIAADLDSTGGDPSTLRSLAAIYSVAEINIVGKDGLISASTNPEFVNFDMSSGEQAEQFLVLLGTQKELVCEYAPITYDTSLWRKYAGAALENGDFVQVGYDAENFQRDIADIVEGITRNRHVGENGSVFVCDADGKIVSDGTGHEGENIAKSGLSLAGRTEGVSFIAGVYGTECAAMYTVSEGYTIIAVMPHSDAFFSRDVSVYIMAFMEIIMFAILFAMIYFLIKKLVVNNINEINNSLAQITGGNLDVTVNVRSNEEFASLSDDINSTIVTLKRYIAEAAARIDRELEFARTIQLAALPSVFPPFPGRAELDLFASMDAAKEVGGDFYDYYLLDDNRLALLIADVSGKGIPAAMFMMTAKTLVKSLAESGLPANETLTRANNELCNGNKAGMFVTMWFGILDTSTGLITYANAGHNPPLLRHSDGEYEYIKCRPGLVLAGMEGVKYRLNELQIEKGDTLFLYTDGVTEATDAHNELYGEQRLKAVLDANADASAEHLIKTVRKDIDAFVGEAPQFDDITMLSLVFGKEKKLKTLSVSPVPDQTPIAAEFVESTLTEAECPAKIVMKMNIAFDELFTNIVSYSGATEASVSCGAEDGFAVLKLCDNGTPYDPTLTPEPDITLSAEERKIGGLGILMVRKSMDSVEYEYSGGRNIVTVKKRL